MILAGCVEKTPIPASGQWGCVISPRLADKLDKFVNGVLFCHTYDKSEKKAVPDRGGL
jgi:hypothetical protein